MEKKICDYNMNQKRIYFSTLLSIIAMGTILMCMLYFVNMASIIESIVQFEGMWAVVLIILIRIVIVSGMAYYTFLQWFKQEEQYLSDIPFLFGVLFLILSFGKALDLFLDLSYYQLDPAFILFLSKSRLLLLILDLIPMIYLSIGMILYVFALRLNSKKFNDEKHRDKIRLRIIIVIIIIELSIVIIAPSITIISIIFPFIVIPSIITIVWLFAYVYKHKSLSQVNALILSIGFGILLVSQIVRPLLHVILGESPTFIIIAEIIDLSVFGLIFIGFYKKANYIKD